MTREEVRESVGGLVLQFLPSAGSPEAEARLRQQIEVEVAKRMQADVSGDGRIGGPEMLAFAKAEIARQPVQINPMVAAALALDENKDGRTTLSEFLAAAERVFRRIDVDGDGTISKEEIETSRRQAAPRRQ